MLSINRRLRAPTRINDRDCGWCGAVALQGPFAHPDYETLWYLCDYCAENVGRMEPVPESIDLEPNRYSMTITVDGTIVARFANEE